MPTYLYECKCGSTEEVICPMSERKSSIRCKKCKKMMPQVISGGVHGYVGSRTVGMQINKNTDSMSLDSKIHYGTQKYQELNPALKPELAREDRDHKIAKEIKAITKAHNS